MKHLVNIVFLLALILTFGRDAGAVRLYGDPNSDQNPHNLSFNSNNSFKAQDPASGGTTEICVFCHTPHGASAQSTLWNRPDLDPSRTFPLYNSGTLQIKSIAAAQYNSADPTKYPNGASRMCLSCHDGSTAFGYSIGDVLNPPNTLTGGTTIAMASGKENLNGQNSQIDLAQSHPISFVYTDAVRVAINSGKGNYYQLPDSDVDVNLDGQDRMQCTACHDPHNATQLDGGGLPKFWVKTTASAYDDVCAACHLNFGLGSDEWGGSDPGKSTHHNPGFGQ